MKSETPVLRYVCPKCGGKRYKISEIRVAYSLFTQMFELQAAKYTALICEKCKYTEFYNLPAKSIKEAFDFFPGRG
jgi:predicted nucleic-acid-binding Zn-ribbon protein